MSIKSLNCLTLETIELLKKHRLFAPLLENEIQDEKINSVAINDELKQEVMNKFINKLGLKTNEEFDEWIHKNKTSKKDIEDMALKNIRFKEYCKNNFSHKVESRFLERKSELDIVVYSLIRCSDRFKAEEIYLRLVEEEEDFGTLSSIYSEGLENRTRGVIGPLPIGKAHPKLAEVLRTSAKGVVQAPFLIDNSFLVVRVESLDSAKLDNTMREKMAEELFYEWRESEARTIGLSLVKQLQTANTVSY